MAVLLKLVQEFVFADQSLNLLALFLKVVGDAFEGVIIPFFSALEVG